MVNMNLLPKTNQEFSRAEYWDTFFKKRGQKSFEWYGEYPELCGYLHKYTKCQDNVLVLGCGNSSLSADLHDVGYRNIVSVDISHVVIKQMQSLHSQLRPELKFVQMDALNMSFDDNQFSVILDKGTLDALMPDDTTEVKERIQKMFSEVDRVLKLCGRYIIVSLLQEHILQAILDFFCALGWIIRIIRCPEAEKRDGASSGLAVFIIVCTKVKLPGSQSVLEFSTSAAAPLTRLKDSATLIETIKEVQNSALVCTRVSSGGVSNSGPISLDLFTPNGSSPRYSVHIADKPGTRNTSWSYAVFIVPQGRETEWMFGTAEGRECLRKSVSFDRVAVVTLHRGHEFPNLEDVKDELTECALQLAPKGHSGKIQFLSLGNDVGDRKECLRSTSDISGEFVVEEVQGDNGQTFRRLIFLNNLYVTQSEARLKKLKSRKGVIVDVNYLACEHHLYMTVGVAVALNSVPNNDEILVIGLGGGALCTYIYNSFPKVKITAVDIDPQMETIATTWFGLPRDERIKCVVEDGTSYLKKATGKGQHFAAVLFDVDSKDATQGLSCPPRNFLEKDVIQAVRSLVGDKGVFVLNLVCRSETLRSEIVRTLSEVFLSVSSYKLEEDVNEVLFCCKTKIDKNIAKQNFRAAAEKLNESSKRRNVNKDEWINVTKLLNKLKIS